MGKLGSLSSSSNRSKGGEVREAFSYQVGI